MKMGFALSRLNGFVPKWIYIYIYRERERERERERVYIIKKMMEFSFGLIVF